jgi:hypothetical protein
MKPRPGGNAEAADIAGVLWNLRFDQDNVKHGGEGFNLELWNS